MTGFKVRSTKSELMDQPGVDQEEVRIALKELNIINTWLGGYKPVLDGIREFSEGNMLRVVDIGSGGGDVLRKVWKWGYNNGIDLDLTGLDINPIMTAYSTSQSMQYSGIKFITGDAMHLDRFVSKPDLIISTLFCHHFDDDELVALVQAMKNSCTKGFIINDLHRHWFAWGAIKVLTQLFSKSSLVKHDGPLSVKRALKRNEWLSIFELAGIKKIRIKWFWAWRWQIIYRKEMDVE